jgi:RHS repeat-associated protein
MCDETGELRWAAGFTTWGALRGVRKPIAANDSQEFAAPTSGAHGGIGSYHRATIGSLALKPATDEAAYDCPIRFPGQWQDPETGLYYNRHRYYDPLAAQYMSPDPIGLEGGDRPQGYVLNPAAWSDPLGLKRWGPHEKGPLGNPNDPNSAASTFRSGSYTERVLEKPIVVYRAHGGRAGPVGQFMTSVKPTGPTQAILDSALNPDWRNTATAVHQFTLPAGTTIYEGVAGPQVINGGAGSLYGGGPQIFVPRATLQKLGLMP